VGRRLRLRSVGRSLRNNLRSIAARRVWARFTVVSPRGRRIVRAHRSGRPSGALPGPALFLPVDFRCGSFWLFNARVWFRSLWRRRRRAVLFRPGVRFTGDRRGGHPGSTGLMFRIAFGLGLGLEPLMPEVANLLAGLREFVLFRLADGLELHAAL